MGSLQIRNTALAVFIDMLLGYRLHNGREGEKFA